MDCTFTKAPEFAHSASNPTENPSNRIPANHRRPPRRDRRSPPHSCPCSPPRPVHPEATCQHSSPRGPVKMGVRWRHSSEQTCSPSSHSQPKPRSSEWMRVGCCVCSLPLPQPSVPQVHSHLRVAALGAAAATMLFPQVPVEPAPSLLQGLAQPKPLSTPLSVDTV